MNEIVKLFLLGLLTTTLTELRPLFGHLIAIFLTFFGIRIYTITDGKKARIYSKIILETFKKDDQPYGLIFGRNFIGMIGEKLWIITKPKVFKEIFENDGKKNLKMKWWAKAGHCFTEGDRLLTFINVSPPDQEPTKEQHIIMEKISSTFMKKKYCVSLISGKPGEGKSWIGMLLCKYFLNLGFNVHFIDTYRPTQPGHDFNSIHMRISPGENDVIIVLIDEVDICIRNILKQVPPHQFTEITAMDKSGWNLFLDHFAMKYKRVILIMTTNRRLRWFDWYDWSLMRDNRVNVKATLGKKTTYNFGFDSVIQTITYFMNKSIQI
jgi:hypothetical protein